MHPRKLRPILLLELAISCAAYVCLFVAAFAEGAHTIVIDGNFSVDHLKMRRPENDVALSPGGQYIVEPARYEAHLGSTVDSREVSHHSTLVSRLMLTL